MADDACESGAGRTGAWGIRPEVLVKDAPDRVRELLDGSGLLVAVYETSAHVHRRAAAGVRRQLLALDALRYAQRQLAAEIREVGVGQEADTPWVVRWATGTDLDARLLYALPASAEVRVVATVDVDGRGLAFAGCEDGTLHGWDLATGRRFGKAVTGHPGAVRALATAVLDGRPVAATGSCDAVVRLWDLTKGDLVDAFPVGDEARVNSLATGLVEGRPVVVGGSTDGVVRVWDLTARTQRGDPLTIHTGTVCALATAVLDGRPAAVTSHSDGTVRAWDLITGREFDTLSDRAEEPHAVTHPVSDRPMTAGGDGDGEVRLCATLRLQAMPHLLVTDPTLKCPMAISANAYEMRVWNLATGEQVGEPVPVGFVETAALRVLHGRPAALVAYAGHGPVEVWDRWNSPTGPAVGDVAAPA